MEELPCITPQAGGSAVALTAARQECQCWGSREGREEGRVCVRVTELVMTLAGLQMEMEGRVRRATSNTDGDWEMDCPQGFWRNQACPHRDFSQPDCGPRKKV